ncbi:hypothetical protein KIH74_30855 [Kineosporia sp. J2-2]|uniref:Uncharacterized protein n=1 Tax=Kineosporia corallincola TaxID=2835133 RepID=A0ABS5TRG7_9ACTN|nr:hypothetical protein [Kineosporia corallincola]MBT0773386.1 hypothetical protein [Kineosporia corallincola]
MSELPDADIERFLHDSSTGWDFDSDQEFHAHLLRYGHLLYGDASPDASA